MEIDVDRITDEYEVDVTFRVEAKSAEHAERYVDEATWFNHSRVERVDIGDAVRLIRVDA